MFAQLHNRQSVLLALAIGGLIGLLREIVTFVAYLYRFALTPQGLAAVVVASVFLSMATLVAIVMRRF